MCVKKFNACQSVRFLFLMWTTLNMKVPLILRLGRKWKGLAGNNCKRALNIEFEQDWSDGLGATLGADRKLKKIFFLFLRWTTLKIRVSLVLRVGRKWTGRAGDNCKSTLKVEFEQDWSVGLGATLRDKQKIKKYFSSFKDFSGKSR